MNAAEARQKADDFHSAPDREYERVKVAIAKAVRKGKYQLPYSFISGPSHSTVKYVLDKLRKENYRCYTLARQHVAVIKWGKKEDGQ